MRLRQAVLLAVLSLIWGASYLLIKYAARDLSEPVIVFSRTALAAVALMVFIKFTGGSVAGVARRVRAQPGSAALLGFTAIALPFLLITYGERTVPSGLTATLIASAPIFIAIFAPFLDRSEVMSGKQWVGLIVGLVGVSLLVGVEQVDTRGELLGALAVIGAAASYGVSGFILKRSYPGVAPLETGLISVGASAIMTAPLVLTAPPTERPGPLAVFAILVLGLLGTAYAFVIYYQLIAEMGFGRSSVVAYTIPPVSLAYGALLLDEAITAAMIGGMALILFGVFLIARARRSMASVVPVDPLEQPVA